MRALLILALLISGSAVARAQEQERKLLDRLLKPDMELQNPSQGKEYAPRSAAQPKQARTKTFSIWPWRREKQFGDVRKYEPKQFATEQSRFSNTQANLSTRGQISQVAYPTPGYSGVRPLPGGEQTVATRAFADNSRPFLVRGKSQRALSQQDTPMTIDQVRELLNKNQ